jgi:glycopeptide antibiotics resistance protein
MRVAKVPLWGWWGVAVVIISLPWIGFTATPQWDRLHLLPFTDPEDKPRDLAANIALFVPFGFWFAAGDRTRPAFARAALTAAAVSLVAEAPQLFSTLRNPSATDVVSAMLGSSGGVALRRGLARLAPSRQTP